MSKKLIVPILVTIFAAAAFGSGTRMPTLTPVTAAVVQPQQEDVQPEAIDAETAARAVEAQRIGRALISCREQRRDEMCKHSDRLCHEAEAAARRTLTEDERRTCTFDCETGSMYFNALEGTIQHLRTYPDRKQQIRVAKEQLLGCAQGYDLRALRQNGAPLEPIALPWLKQSQERGDQ